VVAICWHAVRPTEDEPVTFKQSVQGKLTDGEWRELLTPGSPLNLRWQRQVDAVAGYLAQLRDAHVPVLFRPYHEMNGSWFWWGGRPGKDGSAALYRQIYDRLVHVHHLDNLVWVWNVNAPGGSAGAIEPYFPGADVVDVVTMDNYGAFRQEFYNRILSLAGPKPVALAEVGTLPSLAVLERQPRWCYFMVWSEFIEEANPLGLANAVFRARRSITRDDPRQTKPFAAMRALSLTEPAGVAVEANRR
jgi:mannan endo-1,4-beta-mannosidase